MMPAERKTDVEGYVALSFAAAELGISEQRLHQLIKSNEIAAIALLPYPAAPRPIVTLVSSESVKAYQEAHPELHARGPRPQGVPKREQERERRQRKSGAENVDSEEDDG